MRGVIVKDAPYNVRKSECWVVLLRNINPNSATFGQWEPLSRHGWRVVFLSLQDAQEGVLYCGGQLYPRPGHRDGTLINDEDYQRWLLAKHFKVQRYELTYKREMAWGEYTNGWVPSLDDFETGKASPAITWRVYESRFANTPKGMFLNVLHNQTRLQ